MEINSIMNELWKLSTIVFVRQLNSYKISEQETSLQAKHVFRVTKRIWKVFLCSNGFCDIVRYL